MPELSNHCMGRFTPNQIHWDCLALLMCNNMVICPSGPNGHAHRNKTGLLELNIVDAETLQPLGRFTPNQIHWNHLGL